MDNHHPKPRELRRLIASGKWEFASRRPPTPPEEWRMPRTTSSRGPEWRREAMQQSIQAAVLFLRGREWGEIAKRLGYTELPSRQWVGQVVRRGTLFLISRDWIRPKTERK